MPCIMVLKGAELEMKGCTLRGDTNNEPASNTAGIVSINSNLVIEDCDFNHFKSGGIMLQARPHNFVKIWYNRIVSCATTGIYI